MEIEFGWTADGADWASASAHRARSTSTDDPAGENDAAPDARLGPRGLVALLQGRLALTHPPVEQAVRIAQTMRLIGDIIAEREGAGAGGVQRSATRDDTEEFWPERSFAVDPWSTAAHLLRLRDASIEAGWNAPDPVHGLPARLAAVRDLEHRAVVGMPGTCGDGGRPASLSPGPADDLRDVIATLVELDSLGVTWPLGIDAITLAEYPTALPGLWPRLFELLDAAGVRLRHAGTGPQHAPDLEVVQCLDEWSAADVAARFLSAPAGPDPTGSDQVPLSVLATTDTTVLDRALHRRGMPALGAVEPSTDRAHHQVLGLFLDVATAPVDVHQLAALLDLRVLPGMHRDDEPIGLVPAPVRRELLRALTREPGIGPAWREALARLEEKSASAPAESRDRERRALEAARGIDRLVRDPLPADGLLPGAIAGRLDLLTERLRAVARGEGDLLASLAQVTALREVLGMLGPGAPLSRRTLQQVIDACGGAGRSPLARAEVAPWAVTTRPAQLHAEGGTVLWWGPAEDALPSPMLWDPDEVQTLEEFGARLLPPAQESALHVGAALRALRGASRLIAVLPGRRLEKEPTPSGLLTHLESAAGRSAKDRLTPAQLVDGTTWSLAGRSLPLRTPDLQKLSSQQLTSRSAGHRLDHLLPERMSFTQAQALLECPHRWLLEYALGIRPAQVASLPTGPRMIGTLVHAVVETLVDERMDPGLGGASLEPPDPGRIGEVFDALVPQLASELDLPGRAFERTEVRDRAVRSLRELFAGLADAGLRVTGTESEFSRPLTLRLARGPHEVVFGGSRDLDAQDAEGHPTVIDLKWSFSRTRYGDLFDTGEAIQLASYAWSLAEDPDSLADADHPADVGYFLLRSGEFVSANRSLDAHRRTPMDVADAWRRLVEGVQQRLDEIAGGTVALGCQQLLEAAGIPADAEYRPRQKAVAAQRDLARAEGGILVEDHCARGDYAQLCLLTGGN
ncbi:PD-(D/E)XK nuclease family protein [Brachybacterium sp. MASK1Z-5]|uniref:PD-(D/E)XK nuclease family protein n=1 Tax=Brachybacterium halotolerans TaxID=2795215 RepID=A0ABS1BAW2_9MICO|nr:PD-(D/E)XK nuclease family protein [Brachybacterium halotolerans]MBK0331748.1 PD-(D/E)XK nuclease family protein [Brachybacterium halotolerans]